MRRRFGTSSGLLRRRDKNAAQSIEWYGGASARKAERREAAVAAQAARTTAEKAHEEAKAHGLVEKTAGESGAAGVLRNKWAKWLGSEHGGDVAARLAAEGGGMRTDRGRSQSRTAPRSPRYGGASLPKLGRQVP
ncbi:hypothetical protein OAO87_00835 [bacterium]|nr:hypothetical protein [bacterium]